MSALNMTSMAPVLISGSEVSRTATPAHSSDGGETSRGVGLASRPRSVRREAVVSLDASRTPAMLVRCGSLIDRRASRTRMANCGCSFIYQSKAGVRLRSGRVRRIFNEFSRRRCLLIHRRKFSRGSMKPLAKVADGWLRPLLRSRGFPRRT
jgi:hypothetical protein